MTQDDAGEGDGGRPGALDRTNPFVRWGLRAWLVVGILLAGWLLWMLAGVLRLVLFPLILAMFPASVLQPLANRLARWMNRSLAALLSTLLLVVLLAGVVTLVGMQVSSQLSNVSDQVSTAWSDAQERLQQIPGLEDASPGSFLGGSSGEGGATDSGSASGGESSGSSDGPGGGGASTGGGSLALTVVNGTLRFLTQLLLGLVAVFFYIRDGERIGGFIERLFPAHRRDDAREVSARAWATTTEYIRGQTFVALFDGTFVAIGLLLAGIPLALALGVLVFVGAYVPVVGSIVAGSLAVLVALVTGGVTKALIALAIVVAVQQIEGNILAPYVLGRELEIHPLAVLAAVTAGAAVMGPFGAIVAVPLAASVNRAGTYLREQQT